MKRIPAFSYPFLVFGVLVVLPVIFTLLLIPGMAGNFLSTKGFMPHVHCYLQNMRAVWLHVSSDALIGLSYVAISAMLAYLVFRARKDIPFQWMFLAFGIFIITCGGTHLMEVWTMWQPRYWLSGTLKLITAVASVATASAMPLILPKVFLLIDTAKASERRKVELERAHAELEQLYRKVKDLDELKSNFFANVSHELRTPLTLILGQTAHLIDRAELGREGKAELDTIRRNGLVLLRHVNDLLDASKLEAGKMEMHYRRTNLAVVLRLVSSHFPSLAESRGITFLESLPPELWAEIDAEKVERVAFNLLSNAMKFVPKGGQVRLELKQSEEKAIFLVQDNGPGIPADQREEVFERFRQLDNGPARQAGGTGLGLAITRDFVDLHGGRVWVEESLGGGATFVVELPLKAPPGTKVEIDVESPDQIQSLAAQTVADLLPPARINRPPGDDMKPRVLLVEDNQDMADYITKTLESDFSLLHARDGLEALQQLQTIHPELIISDLMMPRMSGDQLVQTIRHRPEMNEVPIVVLSAKVEDQIRIELLRNGAQDYLIKPFAPEELKARVSNLYELKKTKQNLLDVNAQLEQFNYSVSHDLRAPIRSVKGFGTMLREDFADSFQGAAGAYLEKIIHAASRMERLIDDLLSYSRVWRGDLPLETVDLRESLDEAQTQMESAIVDAKAHLWIQGEYPKVIANRTVLTQAIANLISNGVKYVPPGVKPQVRIWARLEGGRVRLFVQDNGIGIKREHLEKIFRPFERLHGAAEYPGTGVGLALVKKGIERMNGTVGVESEPAKGSTFWMELPAA
jgi:signal transduction histidine kinase